jgi:hypothetical protein
MSALKQVNGTYDGGGNCSYDHEQIERLISATEQNGLKLQTLTDHLTAQYNQIIKWLLIVVCVIALGAKLVELAKDFWGKHETQQAR